MKSFNHLVGAFALLSLAACNSKQVEYFSFQKSEDGYWGLIDHKGNVLFADEFENEIISVSDGVLCTTDDDGLYQYYTVEKKPRLIAEGFKDAGVFHEGLAPVAMKDEWIKFIDKKGNVAFELKEIDGKQVEWVSEFHFGVAIYQLEDGSNGLINTKGKILSEPRRIGINFCTEGVYRNSGYQHGGIYGMVIDNEHLMIEYSDATLLIHYKDFVNGNLDKALYRVDNGKHTIRFYRNSKYYCVETGKKHLIMDGKKEVLSVARDSKIAHIYDIMGKHLLFSNEDVDKKGEMDMKGNVVIRPKYYILNFMDENTLICSVNEEEFKIIDFNDNVISENLDISEEDYYYDFDLDFYLRNGVTWFADADDEYYFVDKKGERINNNTYYRISDAIPYDRTTESDFFNINKLVETLNITATGIGGVTINNTVEEFVEFDNENLYEEKSVVDYTYEDEMEFYKYIDGVKVEYYPSFDQYIAINAVSEYGGTSLWNSDCKLDKLIAGFYLTGEYEGRGEAIYKGLCELFTSKSIKHAKGKNRASFRFQNLKDLRLVYDDSDESIVFLYCNFTMSDESFYDVNE